MFNLNELDTTIGDKSKDTYLTDNLYGKLSALLKHVHGTSYNYPTLAAGKTLTAGNGWALGSKVEIVPASTIGDHFDIHWLNTGVASEVATYEIHLFKGGLGAEIFIGSQRTTRISNQAGALSIPIMTELLNANERISAAVASSTNGATIVVSLTYHTY